MNVYIGLGSNLGDRKKNIKEALCRIEQIPMTNITKVSSIIETKPIACEGDMFLNCAVRTKSSLDPMTLLTLLERVEIGIGRNPLSKGKMAARVIDLDILLFGDIVIKSERLTIPHPRLHERDFALIPLKEVIADDDRLFFDKFISGLKYAENQ